MMGDITPGIKNLAQRMLFVNDGKIVLVACLAAVILLRYETALKTGKVCPDRPRLHGGYNPCQRNTIERRYLEKTNMLKTPKAIKRDILSKFRSQLDDHDTIPPKWLHEDYCPLLTSQEKGYFIQAVSDLIEKGLIEKVNDCIPTLRLTDKGADLIC